MTAVLIRNGHCDNLCLLSQMIDTIVHDAKFTVSDWEMFAIYAFANLGPLSWDHQLTHPILIFVSEEHIVMDVTRAHDRFTDPRADLDGMG